MTKKIVNINEQELRTLIRKKILEQSAISNQDSSKKNEEKRKCISDNVATLNEIIGDSENFANYTTSTRKRTGGIKGMVDTLELLKTLRLNPAIKDGGEHLAYDLMSHLNKFRTKNYFDETTQKCSSAMDKIIELYREDEHGEDLVKDIEIVINHPSRSDYPSPTPRTKEYLKQCLNIIKGK